MFLIGEKPDLDTSHVIKLHSSHSGMAIWCSHWCDGYWYIDTDNNKALFQFQKDMNLFKVMFRPYIVFTPEDLRHQYD